jgi:hypothetical protein
VICFFFFTGYQLLNYRTASVAGSQASAVMGDDSALTPAASNGDRVAWQIRNPKHKTCRPADFVLWVNDLLMIPDLFEAEL